MKETEELYLRFFGIMLNDFNPEGTTINKSVIRFAEHLHELKMSRYKLKTRLKSQQALGRGIRLHSDQAGKTVRAMELETKIGKIVIVHSNESTVDLMKIQEIINSQAITIPEKTFEITRIPDLVDPKIEPLSKQKHTRDSKQQHKHSARNYGKRKH